MLRFTTNFMYYFPFISSILYTVLYNCPPDRPFQCDNGVCIMEAKRCNGDIDCLDKSDQANCGMINK